jgi:hypothetical protein
LDSWLIADYVSGIQKRSDIFSVNLIVVRISMHLQGERFAKAYDGRAKYGLYTGGHGKISGGALS